VDIPLALLEGGRGGFFWQSLALHSFTTFRSEDDHGLQARGFASGKLIGRGGVAATPQDNLGKKGGRSFGSRKAGKANLRRKRGFSGRPSDDLEGKGCGERALNEEGCWEFRKGSDWGERKGLRGSAEPVLAREEGGPGELGWKKPGDGLFP